MRHGSSILAMVVAFVASASSCSDDDAASRGTQLTGEHGGPTAGSSGAGGTSAGGSTSGSAGTSGSGGNDASMPSDANDAGEAGCTVAPGTQTARLDCFREEYEYFAPGCEFSWYECERLYRDARPPDPLPGLTYTIRCRAQGSGLICDCLDGTRVLNSFTEQTAICDEHPTRLISVLPQELYQRFFNLAIKCGFCYYPS